MIQHSRMLCPMDHNPRKWMLIFVSLRWFRHSRILVSPNLFMPRKFVFRVWDGLISNTKRKYLENKIKLQNGAETKNNKMILKYLKWWKKLIRKEYYFTLQIKYSKSMMRNQINKIEIVIRDWDFYYLFQRCHFINKGFINL